MPNPFDRFDKLEETRGGNPFDRFDDVGSTSVVTGKPIPTSQEKIKMSGEGVSQLMDAAKSAGPIVGDIALTAMMPGIGVPKTAGTVGRLGIQGLNALMKMGAAGAGGAGGEFLTQVATGANRADEIDTQQVINEAKFGAVGEGLVGVGGPILNKFIVKPLGKVASNFTVVGNKAANRIREKMFEKSTQRAIDFVSDVAPDSYKASGDFNLNKMTESALDEVRAQYKPYKEALEKEAAQNESGKVYLDNTSQYLDGIREKVTAKIKSQKKEGYRPNPKVVTNQILREFGMTPKKGYELSVFMNDGTATPEQVDFILRSFSETWGKASPTQRKSLEELKKTMLGDMESFSKDAGTLKKLADENYKATIRFKKVIDIYKRAVFPDSVSGELKFFPGRFIDAVESNSSKLKNDLPEIWPKIKDEVKYYKKIAPELKKRGKKEFLGTQALGGTAGFAFGGPAGIAVAEGFGLASSYALLDETTKKIIAKSMKYGVKPSVKAGSHLIGNLMFSGHETN